MPDASVLRTFFGHASRRIGVLAALGGAAVGVALAALWQARGYLTGRGTPDSTMVTVVALAVGATVGAAFAWWRSSRRRARVAHEIEQRAPGARNLLITAHELLSPSGERHVEVTSAVASLVQQRAEQFSADIDVRALFPAARRITWLAGSVLLWAGSVALSRRTNSDRPLPSPAAIIAAVTGRIDIQRVEVRIAPPDYAGQTVTTARDPVRIDALAGSVVTVTIAANADTIVAVTRQGTQALVRNAGGSFGMTFSATLDGFVALEPRTTDGRVGPRRLIGVTVRTDEAPRVRIVAPARDMIIPDARRTLDVRLEADDDLAVGTLRLRYTKVSGSGERYSFSEGEVPVAIGRTKATQWSARAALALEPLLQEPGDLVVYRAVATDRRPGSPAVESDAYIAELAAPGGIAALGFSLDPDEDRYALSQQMVILKTERLIAKRATVPAAALADEAAQIASEQRRVRAEFVFMMGGEFAQEVTGDAAMDELDETHEAESESDLAAGRMVNRGRTALLAAVRAMSRAAVALNTADLAPALVSERRALSQLQEAFARSRFLMRALSQREQLDPTRRLTGRLDSIARSSMSVPDGERDARRAAWRGVLSEVIALGDQATPDAGRFTALAERVLQIDASSAAAQRIATQLAAAGAAFSASSASPRVRALLDSAATAITTIQRVDLRPAAPAPLPSEQRRLQSLIESARRDTGRAATRGGRP
ncbi:MAG: hypothetical protein IPP90_22360 [Gemmatimonadaceae bacterium]|nr:hypothetical protein [Gemmatimonadaceae bacterium]